MHGLIRAESSAERAAREAAEARQAQANEQRHLLEEQNRLLATVASSAADSRQAETLIRLSCGHAVIITDPRVVRWLSVEGEVSYHCRTCDADVPVVGTGNDASPEPSLPDDDRRRPTSSQLTGELERLASLHASGALTDAEFQAAKARLLGM